MTPVQRTAWQIPQLLVFTALLLYFGRTLFIPMFYGLLIAIVLYPLCKWLERRRWPRSLAISAGMLIVLVLFTLLILLLLMQVNAFQKDFPALKAKLEPLIPQWQLWIEQHFRVSVAAQNEWVQHWISQLGDSIGPMLRGSVNALFMLLLVPVFAVLFLYNRKDFVRFLESIPGISREVELHTVLRHTIHAYHQFIRGMILVYIIVGTLNSLGLMALGIRHAILFGFLTAIMTMIPYVGIIVSSLLPISAAWVSTGSVWYPLGVVAVFSVVQYLEANVIFPRVVGTQLNISTWAILVAILAGGIIWGVSGMILFIPFVGILKIIAGHIPAWKPLHYLLSR